MQVYIFPEKITVLELCKGIWKYFSGFFNFTELEEGHLSDYSVRWLDVSSLINTCGFVGVFVTKNEQKFGNFSLHKMNVYTGYVFIASHFKAAVCQLFSCTVVTGDVQLSSGVWM